MFNNDKREEWIKYVEEHASLLLNLTPNLPSQYEKLQELDTVTFLRQLKKDILSKTDKTVVLAVFEVE